MAQHNVAQHNANFTIFLKQNKAAVSCLTQPLSAAFQKSLYFGT